MKEKIKVLMVGPDRSVHGGISAVVNAYYEAGLQELVNIRYIGTMKEGSKLRKLMVAGTSFLRFLTVLPFCDVVHVHMASDNSYRRKSLFVNTASLFHKKIIIHQHGGDIKNFYHKELSEEGQKRMRDLFAKADLFFVLTPEWAAFFKDLVDEKKIRVVTNSISIPDLSDKVYGKKQVLFLGRICKDKGIGELFSCIRRLHEKDEQVKLLLGGIWEDMQLKEEALKYPECFSYLGWIGGEEKEKALFESDVFVLPSYYEGQPVSVLEAMASACAVVATRVGGIPEMIEDGKTGLLIEPRDEKTLEDALEKVLTNPTLAENMGKCARTHAADHYAIEKSMESLLKYYEYVTTC